MFGRYAYVRQNDGSDCGAAGLATIALHYRMHIPLQQLRAKALHYRMLFPLQELRVLAGTDAARWSLTALARQCRRMKLFLEVLRNNIPLYMRDRALDRTAAEPGRLRWRSEFAPLHHPPAPAEVL